MQRPLQCNLHHLFVFTVESHSDRPISRPCAQGCVSVSVRGTCCGSCGVRGKGCWTCRPCGRCHGGCWVGSGSGSETCPWGDKQTNAGRTQQAQRPVSNKWLRALDTFQSNRAFRVTGLRVDPASCNFHGQPQLQMNKNKPQPQRATATTHCV